MPRVAMEGMVRMVVEGMVRMVVVEVMPMVAVEVMPMVAVGMENLVLETIGMIKVNMEMEMEVTYDHLRGRVLGREVVVTNVLGVDGLHHVFVIANQRSKAYQLPH
ncbi:hypothetical protein SO802_019511 [Lithocarpus litseifolius]|uniref:Uncharacterized protein n=1 Tax=Lithocarpus litseifolius TaxID=425828 RepID=A0AAW2CPE0_9ROSI